MYSVPFIYYKWLYLLQRRLSLADNITSADRVYGTRCTHYCAFTPDPARAWTRRGARERERVSWRLQRERASSGDILDSWVNGDRSLKHRIRWVTRSHGQNRTQLPLLSRPGPEGHTETDTERGEWGTEGIHRWVSRDTTEMGWLTLTLVSLTS